MFCLIELAFRKLFEPRVRIPGSMLGMCKCVKSDVAVVFLSICDSEYFQFSQYLLVESCPLVCADILLSLCLNVYFMSIMLEVFE